MEVFVLNDSNEKKIVKIQVGLKINTRDFILKELQEIPYIRDNFKLNVKRLNRWWYSVYFDKKED